MPQPFENAEEVFFQQSDPRWGHLPYAGFTVSWAGCGLVAYTMCVDVVTGVRFTPGDVYNMRKKWGVRQVRPGGIFAKDAYTDYARMHRELFGVETEFLTDKSVYNVARVLDSGAVVWASSRDIGEPWLNRDGSRQSWQHAGGHFACIWKHENGVFYMKDSSGPAYQHNDVPYTRKQMSAWLVGALENRYIIRPCA